MVDKFHYDTDPFLSIQYRLVAVPKPGTLNWYLMIEEMN
jgi:hypothetical protein